LTSVANRAAAVEEGLHQRTPGRSHRPSSPWTLGRGPHHRLSIRVRNRNSRGANHPLSNARSPAPRPQRRERPRRPRRHDRHPPHTPAPIVDLGPGHRDGTTSRSHSRHRHGDLLLRPPLALAARQQREHQIRNSMKRHDQALENRPRNPGQVIVGGYLDTSESSMSRRQPTQRLPLAHGARHWPISGTPQGCRLTRISAPSLVAHHARLATRRRRAGRRSRRGDGRRAAPAAVGAGRRSRRARPFLRQRRRVGRSGAHELADSPLTRRPATPKNCRC
jgi:hypothetical protein